jgi:methanol metabolism-related c-type cytochrome
MRHGRHLGSAAAFAASLLALAIACTAHAQTTDPAPPSTAAKPGEDKPYQIAADGTVEWALFNGYRRYHATCHACHGPDGLGSTIGPNLTDSLKTRPFEQFREIVTNGKQTGNKKMPALGTDRNVMCYLDDIYAYLKARSDNALGRGRPAKYQQKPDEAAKAEDACMAKPR